MERLKEIITKNYTLDFPEGIEIENHEERIKTVRQEEQPRCDSDHVIDDETDDIICIDLIQNKYIISTVLFFFPTCFLLKIDLLYRFSFELLQKKKNYILEKFRQEIIRTTQNFGRINIRTEKNPKFCPAEIFGF